jgi:anti-sigma-K factor RskA
MTSRDDGGLSDDLHGRAGEYVLGTLDSTERQAVERALTQDAELRAAVEAWEARLFPLTALAPPIEPSPGLWARIEQGVSAPASTGARISKTPAARRRGAWHGWWTNLALWRGLTAASLAAALAFGLRPLLVPGLGAAPQYVVVLIAPGALAPAWVVRVDRPNELSLTPVVHAASPPDKALQFWTKADTWNAPVSLGLVKPGEAVRLRIDQLPALQPNQLFEITLEPATGSPTGRPTGPIQYIGRAVRLDS